MWKETDRKEENQHPIADVIGDACNVVQETCIMTTSDFIT